MNDTLTEIIKKIVDNPDAISVEEQREESRVIYVIHADTADIGKIIGKNGRIIRALRDIVKLMATKRNIYADRKSVV